MLRDIVEVKIHAVETERPDGVSGKLTVKQGITLGVGESIAVKSLMDIPTNMKILGTEADKFEMARAKMVAPGEVHEPMIGLEMIVTKVEGL